MIRRSFNNGWSAAPKTEPFATLTGPAAEPQPVTLPHDALRDLPRSAASDQGAHTGYFPGGTFTYTKTFDILDDHRDKTVTVEFEGVYRDAVVYINGDFAAQRPNGYAGFAVKMDPYLRYGQPNTITVEARAHRDSRWYTGAGIYRNTHLIVADSVHVTLDGVRITTPDIEPARAVVAVATTLENETRHTRTVRVDTQLLDPGGNLVATESAPVTLLPMTTAVTRVRLIVSRPDLWSPDSPFLYGMRTTVLDGDETLDEEHSRFGIRRLQLDPQHGLRINGEPLKLRGACIHHDTGPLGAAAIPRAEERRIEILKGAGFNAIRSAHNPVSRATLDACDRLGVLVMDELTDVWTKSKTPFDYSLTFPEWWERDAESMIAKDFNHPSVIMYSIGNEIFEVGTPLGSAWGRRLAEKVRSLDDTRFVTNALNGFVAIMDRVGEFTGTTASEEPRDVNSVITAMGEVMGRLNTSDLVTSATEESASVLDVVGFNYGETRYEPDALSFPSRIIVGSETFPGQIDELWRLVTTHAHVVGDFTWTGWDYLGEAGIGRVDYTDDIGYAPTGVTAAYPYLLAGAGDIDITGHRRPMSYYRETVYGLRREPYVAVHRPQHHGRPTAGTPWSWTDSVSSWSWNVPVGSPTTVDVYSDAEEIELLLNGRSVGIAKVGSEKAFLARFETSFEPGQLVAVARTAGHEQARTMLRSATGRLHVHATSDRTTIRADDTDLSYIEIALRDTAGNLATDDNRRLRVAIEGPGTLVGLGTARPDTEETFGATECTTYDGRALAIIRALHQGDLRIIIGAEDCESTTLTVLAAQR